MASGLLLLLDDITTILDDVAILTKVAVKKTAGVLGDDLALNAQQVTGVEPNRELPVVWAVAKGSMINKLILVPSALVLSYFAPWAIEPLMIAGGTYLCFEGCEKLAQRYLHPHEAAQQQAEHESHVADPAIDLVALEKSKVSGAVRTDFILSAEIIVIALGTIAASNFVTQCAVLATVAILMTLGVYGLVAAIVKLDDLGLYLIHDAAGRGVASWKLASGRAILFAAPHLMRFLSIAGTAAMFLVGGGILVHAIEPLHHLIEEWQHAWLEADIWGGGLLGSLVEMLINASVGILVGSLALVIVESVKRMLGRTSAAH